MGGGSYEQEFAAEIARAKTGKAKATPWGSGYGKAPEILHGVLPCMLLLDIRHTACHGGGSRVLYRGQPCDCVCLLQHDVLAVACCACLQLLRLPLQAGMLLHGGLFVLSHAASASLPRRLQQEGEGLDCSAPSLQAMSVTTLPCRPSASHPHRLQQEGEGEDCGGAAGHAGSHEGKAAKGLCRRGCKPVCARSSLCYPCAAVWVGLGSPGGT